MMPISVVVEGPTDTALVQKLLVHLGLPLGTVYEAGGKSKLDKRLKGFNNAARSAPWFVLRDLDQDEPCAPELIKRLLKSPAKHMRLRIAVHQGESWLLADTEQIARFLDVPETSVPRIPDDLPNAKQALINLARKSRSRSIRDAIVPREGSTAPVGREYTSRIAEFAQQLWRPGFAAKRSDSLSRCINALQDFRT
ncbi:hypothetical protein [Melittangium boletus]|uniref:hypothetical protein n=1 Tax=Melittangium boletus TaxID=83453 RepID=UPI003DA3D105